jgi:hypothetical protein
MNRLRPWAHSMGIVSAGIYASVVAIAGVDDLLMVSFACLAVMYVLNKRPVFP